VKAQAHSDLAVREQDQTAVKILLTVLQDVQTTGLVITTVMKHALMKTVNTMLVIVPNNVTLDVQTTGLVMVSVTTPVMLKPVAATKEIVISVEKTEDLMDPTTNGKNRKSAHQDVQKTGSVMAFVISHVRMMTAIKTLVTVISMEKTEDPTTNGKDRKSAHQDVQKTGSVMAFVISHV